MNQKDIVLARFPYTNLVDYKIRPAVIVSNEKFNSIHAYLLACPITSKSTLHEYELELTVGNFSGDLKEKSFVRADGVTAIEKDLILKEIGTISDSLFNSLKERIMKNF
ncbi:MAG: type II toxin-antitoxin system PemK/MazF family toxin [Candidatus Diapherotrites archaeon]